MKIEAPACHGCSAYLFPHRLGSGKCQRTMCPSCGRPCNLIEREIEVGAEYWSRRGVDWVDVSDCCEVEIVK